MAEESGSGGGAGSSGAGGASEDTGNVDASGSGAGAGGDSAAGNSGGGSSGGCKGFAQFSKAERMASHMGSSLINGAMDYQTASQKAISTRARQTIGEEVADHIRKRSSAPADNREHTEFEGDSLSGSKNS